MAKLLLLLAVVCFQFSNQEELTDIKNPDNELKNEGIPAENPLLDGEDKNQWYKEKKDDESDEEWTKDDEKWFQQIQDALKGSDEDYDDDDDDDDDDDVDLEAIKNLINDIEYFIGQAYPEKSKYKWLHDLEKWFTDDFYDDDDDDYAMYPDLKKEENINKVDDYNTDLYYSWLFKMALENPRTKRALPKKRFWSV